MRSLLLLFLSAYQYLVSPLLGPSCRFIPSCSTYAREAILLHGSFKGCLLTAARLARCQPLCKPGYDPVPATLSLSFATLCNKLRMNRTR